MRPPALPFSRSIARAAQAGVKAAVQAQRAVSPPSSVRMAGRQVPAGVLAYPLAGRYAAQTPGLRLEALDRGDMYRTIGAHQGRWHKPRGASGYRLVEEGTDRIVGSITRVRTPPSARRNERVNWYGPPRGDAYVPAVWVHPEWQHSTAFYDLIRAATRGRKQSIWGHIVNSKLARVYEKDVARTARQNPGLWERGEGGGWVRRPPGGR